MEKLQNIFDQIDHFNHTGEFKDQQGETTKVVYDDTLSKLQKWWPAPLHRHFNGIGLEPNTTDLFIPKRFIKIVDSLIDKEKRNDVKEKHEVKRIQYKFKKENFKIRKAELYIITTFYGTFLNLLLGSDINYKEFEHRTTIKFGRDLDEKYYQLRTADKILYDEFNRIKVVMEHKDGDEKNISIDFTKKSQLKEVFTYLADRAYENYIDESMVYMELKGEAAKNLFLSVKRDTRVELENQIFYLFTNCLYSYIEEEDIITQTPKDKKPTPEICQFIVDFYCAIELCETPQQGGGVTVWNQDGPRNGLYKTMQTHLTRHRY